jgi:hypothetical protein
MISHLVTEIGKVRHQLPRDRALQKTSFADTDILEGLEADHVDVAARPDLVLGPETRPAKSRLKRAGLEEADVDFG